jgi:glycosyltransferase involved in cell wall biosynthesis
MGNDPYVIFFERHKLMNVRVNVADALFTRAKMNYVVEPSPIGVMHVVDSLAIGGAERVAVNLVNRLSQKRYATYLCTTRADGPLADLVAPHVRRLQLRRKRTLDIVALLSVVTFIKANDIRILHAHGTSLFFARMAGSLSSVPVIWHDHYGRCELNDRPLWAYRIAVRDIGAVITVNQLLANWSRQSLHVPSSRVRYVPNLIDFSETEQPTVKLPGDPDKRIVCVANLRPQKDHATLLRAMALVTKSVPRAHLLLIGASDSAENLRQVRIQISEFGLNENVSYLGPRRDVAAILRASAIGVLSSISEGLPLALLEYGDAALPAVVTNVGQCAEVVGHGIGGILVPPANPESLSEALSTLLASSSYRNRLGVQFRERVRSRFSAGSIIEQISDIYQSVLQQE